MMFCDWCKQPLEEDATGMHCLEHVQGGHIGCYVAHLQDEHGESL